MNIINIEIDPSMLTFDRASFIAWTEGILLDFKKGKGVVGDNPEFEDSDKHLDGGGRIILTVHGRPVSYVAMEDGVAVEKKLDEDDEKKEKPKETAAPKNKRKKNG